MKNSELITSLGELHAAQSSVELVEWALNDFASKFGAECTIWTQYDSRGSLVGAMLGRETNPEVWNYGPIIQQHVTEHPIFQLLLQAREKKHFACKTTDFASQRILDETPLFRDAYRHMNCRYHMALVLESPSVPRCSLSIGRNGSDYTDAQVRAMQESSRHFLAAMSKLGRIEELERRLATPGTLKFVACRNSNHWYYTHTDEATFRSVTEHFGPAPEKFMVPPPVAAQLQAPLMEPTIIRSLNGQKWNLAIQHKRSNEFLVSLEPGHAQRILLAFPTLTSREAEAALWLCEGKSNPQLAEILGISLKTVEKHLENLFNKLGVETRLEASLRLMEAIR